MHYRMKKALQNALTSRGKHKGLLKAKCPPMGTDEAAMWQAIQMVANPYKVGMGHLCLMSKTQYEFYKDCLALVDRHAHLFRDADRDANTLRRLGVF